MSNPKGVSVYLSKRLFLLSVARFQFKGCKHLSAWQNSKRRVSFPRVWQPGKGIAEHQTCYTNMNMLFFLAVE